MKPSTDIIIHVGSMMCKIEGQPPGFEIDKACSYINAPIAKWLNKDKPELMGNELLAWLYSLPKGQQTSLRKEFAKLGEHRDYWEFLQKSKDNPRYAGMGGWGGGNFDMSPERAPTDEISMEEHRSKRLEAEMNRVNNVVHLYDIANQTFPFGLLPIVQNVLEMCGFTYNVVEDSGIIPKQIENINWAWNDAGYKNRDYQDKSLELASENRYGMFSVVTGGGKSRVVAGIIFQKKVKTLVLVNSEELMYQMYDFIVSHIDELQIGVPGLVGDGQFFVRDITIAIVNSAYSKIERLASYGFDMVIVDEGHHAASKTYFVVLSKLHPYYCYALTGTAFRTSKSEEIALKASFKGVIQHVGLTEMVEKGFLVPAELQMLECNQETDPKLLWPQLNDAAIVSSEARNSLIAKKIKQLVEEGNRVLVAVDQVKQGRNMAKSLSDVGVGCYDQVYGNSPREYRRAAIPKLISGEIKVLIGTVYNEGVNIPNLDVVVNASGKRARIKTFQRVGRALRKVEGKTTARIVDVWDAGHRYLEEHSKDRLKHYIQAGVKIPKEYESRILDRTEAADLKIKATHIDQEEVELLKDVEKLARARKKAVAIRRARRH